MPKQTKPDLLRSALEGLFPQLAVNRLVPSQPVEDRNGNSVVRWRWIRHRLQPDQYHWVAERAPLYWVHWFLAWGAVTWLATKAGSPGGAFLYLGFVGLAGWTLLGVAIAQGSRRLERRRVGTAKKKPLRRGADES